MLIDALARLLLDAFLSLDWSGLLTEHTLLLPLGHGFTKDPDLW